MMGPIIFPSSPCISVPQIISPSPKKQLDNGPSTPSPPRRSIFGPALSSRNSSDCTSKRQRERGVASFISIPGRGVSAPPLIGRRSSPCSNEIDSARLSPVHVIQGLYFRDIRDLPKPCCEELSSSLPAVPSPLQRFYSQNGKTTSLCGAYPLVEPNPILRRSCSAPVTEDISETESPLLEVEDGKSLDDTDTDSTKEMSHSSSCLVGRSIHFDPRITVTEYPDDYQRKWLTAEELERFQNDAMLLARDYLVRHPHLVNKYSKPYFDPITRKMRKRALFSLPVMGCSLEEEKHDTVSAVIKKPVVESSPSKVMVVDRNLVILELFRKSILSLYPDATVTTVQTAEEALILFEKCLASPEDKGYDLVISEQSLDCSHYYALGKSRSISAGLSSSGSLTGTDATTKAKPINPRQVQSASPCMTGAQLFAKITIDCGTPNEVTPVLVGVSNNPSKDATLLQSSGADLIWGKPPPTMDDALRLSINSVLAEKYRQHARQARFQQQ